MQTRRQFVRTGAVAAGALSFGPAFWAESLAAPAKAGAGPYGALGAADANGISLPAGFSARMIARGGQPVAGTSYVWHSFSDGAATYATPDGGWILVSNSEIPTPLDLPGIGPIGEPGDGGASAIRFDADGSIASAYRILSGTSSNCAGGATPWGTWLSCEEIEEGMVWECDPLGETEAIARPALGVFSHEAVCVDPKSGDLYLSEDEGDSGFYRFRPSRKGDLSEGRLSIARVGKRGAVEWVPLPDPSAKSAPTRKQVDDSKQFKRGEGIWFDSGFVYLATTGDSKIRAYDTRKKKITPVYDPKRLADPPLKDVDNVTVARSGDLFVCEDNGDPDGIDIGIITPKPKRTAARFLKLSGATHGDPSTEASSEATGVIFDPSGQRMYFASQRAFGTGAVYEVSGPFRG
ncbi:MAG: alkaline phosphatase PhoX [Solirubrobacterales bacterium]